MTRLPTLFLSHGSPMLALENEITDKYIKTLKELSKKIPTPKAILNIGAHWYGPYKRIDISEKPETIYDFGGFPNKLYNIKYNAPGHIEGEKLIKELIPEISYTGITRGLDHGNWTVLMHLFPEANIPVFSISIDSRDSLEEQLELGKKLRILRDNGILIIANGNIAHNLRTVDFGKEKNKPNRYSNDFDAEFKKHLLNKDYQELLNPYNLEGGKESNPTLEHYIPAIIAIGTSYPEEIAHNIYEGFELGSMGRRAFGFGKDLF